MKPIQDYLDYREALRDYYDSRKVAMPLYSYRMLGNRLGMDASQAFRVLKGELQLTEKAIVACTDMLDLQGKDADYFELLVHFARASSDKEKKILADDFKLAERLGIQTFTLKGELAPTLIEFAKERNVTQLIIGHPRRNRFQEILKPAVLAELVKSLRTVDILVVATESPTAEH